MVRRVESAFPSTRRNRFMSPVRLKVSRSPNRLANVRTPKVEPRSARCRRCSQENAAMSTQGAAIVALPSLRVNRDQSINFPLHKHSHFSGSITTTFLPFFLPHLLHHVSLVRCFR